MLGRGDRFVEEVKSTIWFVFIHVDLDIRSRFLTMVLPIQVRNGSSKHLTQLDKRSAILLHDVAEKTIAQDLIELGVKVWLTKRIVTPYSTKLQGEFQKGNINIFYPKLKTIRDVCLNESEYSKQQITKDLEFLKTLHCGASNNHVVELLTYLEDGKSMPFYVVRTVSNPIPLNERLGNMLNPAHTAERDILFRLTMCQQVLSAVMFCHHNNILLRDVSTVVFIVNASSELKDIQVQLSDFSLARKSEGQDRLYCIGNSIHFGIR